MSKKRCEIATIIYSDGEKRKQFPVCVSCLRIACDIVRNAGYSVEDIVYVG